MPLQGARNIYQAGYSITKYKYVVEYKDKDSENAIWERCIKQHATLNDCMHQYYNMERSGLWELRVAKIAVTETFLYMD